MHCAFTRLRAVVSGQILPHILENRTIGPHGLTACIQLQDGAVGNPNRVATIEQKIREINPINSQISHYYAAFKQMTVDLNLHTMALNDTQGM
jgi:hypothetical protein